MRNAPPNRDPLDSAVIALDRALKAVFAPATAARPDPGAALPEAPLGSEQRRESAALMRVNHSGEIAAQALYHGQATFARDPATRAIVINLAGTFSLIAGIIYGYWRLATPWYFALVFLVFGLGYTALAVVPDYRLGVLADGLGQLGSGFAIPVMIAWVLTQFPEEHRGRGTGLWAACFFLGEFLSPPVVTAIGSCGFTFLQSVGIIGLGCLVLAVFAAGMARRTATADY